MLRRVLHVLGFHPWRQAAEPGKTWTIYQCPICKKGLLVENGGKPIGFRDLVL